MSISHFFAHEGTARHPHWRAVRKAHLKAHPECAVCGTTRRLNVHHIIPVHIDRSLELDPSNLITLCEGVLRGRHHFEFGHLGNWKKYNPTVVADAEFARRYWPR